MRRPPSLGPLIRIVGFVVAAALVTLGWPSSSSATACVEGLTQPIYTYDTPVYYVPATCTAPERGPSVAVNVNTHDAVDHRSDGVLARTGVGTSPTAYIYNDPARFALVARATATTRGQAQGDRGSLSASSRSGVAANTVPSGLPRDALGRFTSGAGGESAATAAGRTAHANYINTLGGGDYRFNVALPGSRLRPDAVSYSQNIVRELKPATPSAISRGWRQVNQYKTYLEELTGQPWTAYVDTYTP